MADKLTMVYMGDDCELAIFCDKIIEENNNIHGYMNDNHVLSINTDKVKIVQRDKNILYNNIRIEFVEASDES